MTTLLFILLAASVGLGFAKIARVPATPVLILTGGLMSNLNLPLDAELAKDSLLLGLAFLVFLSGTALNPWRVGARAKVAFFLGGGQFLLLGLFGFLFFYGNGANSLQSFYLALAVASSSTLVVIKLLQERGELFDPFGRLMVGALLVQDIFMMFMISALPKIEEGWKEALVSSALLLALILIGLIFKKWVIPWLLLRPKVDEEQQLVLALGSLFFFMGASSLFKLHFLTGAFVAGLALSSFPVNGVLKGQFASLNNFFSAVFFVTLGVFVDFPPLQDFGLVVAVSLALIVLTPALAVLFATSAGLTLRAGVEGGLLLAQTSEFSIILALIGLESQHLQETHLSLITSITVVSMILTPFLSKETVSSFVMKLIIKFFKHHAPALKIKGHFLLLGCGESGMVLLEELRKTGHEVVVIDDDIGVIRRLRERGVEAILGNGKEHSVLKKANLENAKIAISSMRKFSDNKSVLDYPCSTTRIIRVFDEEEGRVFSRSGGVPIHVTDAAAQDLVAWMRATL